jgi:ribosome-binding protein aMBF1 (putative translation factor)
LAHVLPLAKDDEERRMTAQEFGALLQSRREAKGLLIEELAARI